MTLIYTINRAVLTLKENAVSKRSGELSNNDSLADSKDTAFADNVSRSRHSVNVNPTMLENLARDKLLIKRSEIDSKKRVEDGFEIE